MKDLVFNTDKTNAELDELKQKLIKLKIECSSALESKAKALSDTQLYNQKTSSSLKIAQELKKQIEEANEEHVLVELARIEAEKELREIESLRASEAIIFQEKIRAAKQRTIELSTEIGRTKDLEEKLAATNTDVSVLQNEMQLIRAMSKKNSPHNIENELRNAKKELNSIREEGFQFMSSMDFIRVELLQISKQTNVMKKLERDTESTIEHLNSKLLKERSKLEANNSAEKRTREIVLNLSTALQQLHTEVQQPEKCDIKQEIEKIEMDIKCAHNKLVDKMFELEKAKALEANAIVSLKSVVEKMVKRRALESQNSSMVCVSMWEYEYLSNNALLAKEVADKKVAAIDAWIETLKAEENEMLLKCEVVEKEIKAMRVKEEEVNNKSSMTVGRRQSKTRRVSDMQGVKSATRSPSFAVKRRKREKKKLSLAMMFRRRWDGGRKQNKVDFDSYAGLLLAHEDDHCQH